MRGQSGANKVEASLRRHAASGMDAVMCAMINGIQWTLRKHVCSAEEFDAYLSACEPLSRELFYQLQEFRKLSGPEVISNGKVPGKPHSRKIKPRGLAFF